MRHLSHSVFYQMEEGKMQIGFGRMGIAVLLLLGAVTCATAADVTVSAAEWEAMKARMADLEARNTGNAVVSSVDTAMDSKYGPGATVVTKTGKLTIGMLTQIWYYSIQNDHRGFFDDPATNTIPDDNSVLDNDGFRIRRAELKFTVDINENVRGVVMIDPAREALGFPNFPSNQGNIKKANVVSPEFNAANDPNIVSAGASTGPVTQVQNGGNTTGAPRLMREAFINWHGCIPHHDVQIGQFKPWVGEEGIRSSSELDFAERSMLGIMADERDLGASIHGSWWCTEGCADSSKGDGRFQYWAGVFNGAGTYFEAGNHENRPNDNDYLDYNARVLVRPIWGDCAGRLELGASFMGGKKGEGSNRDPLAGAINDLARPEHWASRWNAWVSYKAGWELTGLWVSSEWTLIRDRERPGTVLDVLGAGANGTGFAQDNGATFSREGIYGAIGYKFGESKICGIPCWLKPVEILGRYDQFQNISVADAVNPRHTDSFYTKVWTAGVNYYIKGHNAKVQANYNWVDLGAGEHSNATRQFHNVRNDSFVINFQVMF